VQQALGLVSHETIFTLYGGQFSELFAYTLQNCLWKLNPKQSLFVAFEFRNDLSSLNGGRWQHFKFLVVNILA